MFGGYKRGVWVLPGRKAYHPVASSDRRPSGCLTVRRRKRWRHRRPQMGGSTARANLWGSTTQVKSRTNVNWVFPLGQVCNCCRTSPKVMPHPFTVSLRSFLKLGCSLPDNGGGGGPYGHDGHFDGGGSRGALELNRRLGDHHVVEGTFWWLESFQMFTGSVPPGPPPPRATRSVFGWPRYVRTSKGGFRKWMGGR